MKQLVIILFLTFSVFGQNLFKDPNFEKCIRENLNLESYQIILQEDMNTITDLYCGKEHKIQSLIGIENLKNLESFEIGSYQIKKADIDKNSILISGIGLGLISYDEMKDQAAILVREGVTNFNGGARQGNKMTEQSTDALQNQDSVPIRDSSSNNNSNGNLSGNYGSQTTGPDGRPINSSGNTSGNPDTNRGNATMINNNPNNVNGSPSGNLTVSNGNNAGVNKDSAGNPARSSSGIIGSSMVSGETEDKEKKENKTGEKTEEKEIENVKSGGCQPTTIEVEADGRFDATIKGKGLNVGAKVKVKGGTEGCSITVILPPNPWGDFMPSDPYDEGNIIHINIYDTPADPWNDIGGSTSTPADPWTDINSIN